MDIHILFVDDDKTLSKDLADIFEDKEVGNHTIKTDFAISFEDGLKKINENYFDLIVLDLCKGKPSVDAEKEGLDILKEIQKNEFIPIIFYSGIAKAVENLQSEIVRAINKSEGSEGLFKEISQMISSNIATLRRTIQDFVNAELREYFWDIIHDKRDVFKSKSEDYSLGYLMLRRLANALSKEKIKDILCDETIDKEKAHPMEFYIYPSEGEFAVGDIIEKDQLFYLLLTPTCDYVERFDNKGNSKGRKVGKILLARISPLTLFPEYIEYKKNTNTENKNKLNKLIANNHSERFFFLPQTPFINNMIVDFQDKIMVEYEDLSSFNRVTKLDSPYAESTVARFLRYYNRIGTPDIDVDYIIKNL